MDSPKTPLWQEAINSEIESILQNYTWELVDLLLDNKPIVINESFKRNLKIDCTIDRYKAWLIAKGYRQKKGLDYCDKYSLVSIIKSF